jgi:hypothetical protein
MFPMSGQGGPPPMGMPGGPQGGMPPMGMPRPGQGMDPFAAMHAGLGPMMPPPQAAPPGFPAGANGLPIGGSIPDQGQMADSDDGSDGLIQRLIGSIQKPPMPGGDQGMGLEQLLALLGMAQGAGGPGQQGLPGSDASIGGGYGMGC